MSDDIEADLEGVEVPDKMFFRIGEVGRIVGVEPHVLRYWEGEFKLRPQRSPSGQRMYRRKDLVKLLEIKSLLHDQGFTIAGARKAIADGGAPAPAASPGTADSGRVGEASARIAALRKRIREARERFSTVGVATRDSDG